MAAAAIATPARIRPAVMDQRRLVSAWTCRLGGRGLRVGEFPTRHFHMTKSLFPLLGQAQRSRSRRIGRGVSAGRRFQSGSRVRTSTRHPTRCCRKTGAVR